MKNKRAFDGGHKMAPSNTHSQQRYVETHTAPYDINGNYSIV